MLATNILISSSVSAKSGSTSGVGLMRGTLSISRSHLWDSRSSLRQILSLCTKSLGDSADCASPWLGRGEVPERINWPATWFPTAVLGNRSASRMIAAAYSRSRSSRSYFFPPAVGAVPIAIPFDVRCWMFGVRCSDRPIPPPRTLPARNRRTSACRRLSRSGPCLSAPRGVSLRRAGRRSPALPSRPPAAPPWCIRS